MLLFLLTFYLSPFTFICPDAIAATQRIYLTSGTTWTVPSNWNNSNNTIEVIGGGAGGGGGGQADGGGGGAYAKVANVSLTSGSSVTIKVGVGGAWSSGGDTWLCNATSNCADITGSAVQVGAKGGTITTGGSAASSVGTTKYSGGNGGSATGGSAGSGGGGAGGPYGAGGNGGNYTGYACGYGGGGGGGGGGSAGNNYGAGGNNHSGSGGGAMGNVGTNGGGGGGGDCGIAGLGKAGGAGTEWDASHGSGGGSGGASYSASGTGPTAGLYGGGGGSGWNGSGTTPSSGAGGIIVITYTPAGPVGWWRLDEGSGTTTADASGSGLTGTFNDTPTWTAGKFGKAVSENGSQWFTTPSTALFNGNVLTENVWANLSSMGGNPCMFLIDPTNSVYNDIGTSSTTVQVLRTSITVSPAQTWADDQWHMLTWVSDGSATQFYKDAVLLGTGGAGSSLGTGVYQIAGFAGSYSPIGIVDDVRIYNRALSADEVAELYSLGFSRLGGGTLRNAVLK